MLELNPFRKNKINLEDYEYQKDIQNRLLMAHLTEQDRLVLEEILYGHPKLSVSQLAQDLIIDESEVVAILSKLAPSELFSIKDHTIVLNKEMRKYFEAQLQKFDEDFIPGMDYLQSLLRKVSFNSLLTWYPIPRTSNNIFDSLVEKYLLTPQIFQRYLIELHFPDPKMSAIIDEVYNAEDFILSGNYIKNQHNLTDEAFEELLLNLEFNFVCCLVYKKEGSKWVQYVQPFHEWREYLKFIKDSKPQPVENEGSIINLRDSDFAFVEDLAEIYKLVKKAPLPLQLNQQEEWVADKVDISAILKSLPSFDNNTSSEEKACYIKKIIKKMIFLNLCKVENSALTIDQSFDEWFSLSLENRALAIYKQTLSKIEVFNFSAEVATERNVREIEKSLACVVHQGWVEFEDFLRSVTASIRKESKITLRKQGKNWKYSLPVYTEEELSLIKQTILEWLFEAGLVSLGQHNNKTYFRVTPFGQSLFS
jgi:hypothetical protein